MRPTVILRDCPDYDVPRIRSLVRDGLERLALQPFGRTLVKPNCVAAGSHFPHAHTRPEFLEGLLRGLRDCAREDMTELAVGERCGITLPTRFAFREAGYYKMVKRVGNVRLYHFDEETQVEIPLYHPGRLRDCIFTPASVARADFFVNSPKFKAHPWTTVTFSMKNYIGIQDDRHRLIDHDHRLNQKVADLQYIVQPQFIAIDAITAGEGRMLTPIPFDLGLVIMGNNQVAFDSVCCHIIGLDPMEIEHIRLAHERGFGPVDLNAIDIVGDVSLSDAKARARGFRTGLIRVEDYFANSNIRAYGGPPPGDTDYCWGGCPGALEEAIEILRVYDPETDQKIPNLHIVFGQYEGEISAQPEEKVIFMGDCASFHGTIGKNAVAMESEYVDRSSHDPRDAKYNDIYSKMIQTGLNARKLNSQQIVRMSGCPVSVAEQALMLVARSGVNNPYLDPVQAPLFTSCYLSWRTRVMLKRLRGERYNQDGPAQRGQARPHQNFSPSEINPALETS